ncbi:MULTISPECIES: 16S rRNA (guanine(966)-N(2))-methyltransferase RsmD [Salinivibrio]|jgi:16S rRNA (guanine966-N2)-methyltransferase|uniref:16S rRNA (guanine(966)-N(2))-methyltransferase RsmD n=1 Tax=Salinivibrio TaxID=51366 RepID=UPI000985286F|nr:MULTISPECIES: 16S rRNA (guanine(966)-N(2))-methyltransferase RsmD [Salinivibrio]OOF09278.1 16S rRNA (guanine(966)-N(2))-methyltransferase RsmD [Salinivibrio sp. PR919]OOF11863.1 16S rRNA (guanine(966)-N(2))-methyltransferase RsmD [Salinivibrio sp. PR5]OOF18783.1 16S rRNA (guanine(966)-N(2))-methyltransferase RsmD [Salinivibrio sp. PR932]OOF23382.1 16S rRNA (guanine(966)-N(2))-methyltransferase RsmD [Salinivibrio sp. IB574]OOF29671.1 16S rRNA (guanine(966)-N(2))-methyltransferase RsmD [Salin
MVKRASRKPSSASPSRAAGTVRIIAGRWRGRKLAVQDAQGLRPTTDRVKETVFNWLAPYLPGARCLDVFAGSGGLGFEALSRGAAWVTFCEMNPQAAKQLSTNLTQLQAAQANVVQGDALAKLRAGHQGEPFDIVFVDPPFREGLLADTLNALESQGWLSPDACIYVEAENELSTHDAPANWRLHRDKSAGQVNYRLYFREDA